MPKLKPSKFPEWASVLSQSPINKEYNRYEPPNAKKKLGWEFGEVPPRQWVNYQQNLNCQWLEYFDANLNRTLIYASKKDLPEVKASQGLLVYIKDSDSLAFSNGDHWQKLKTTKL